MIKYKYTAPVLILIKNILHLELYTHDNFKETKTFTLLILDIQKLYIGE